MQYDLAAIARQVGKYRRAVFTARAIEPTKAQRDDLQRAYMTLVRGWQAGWRERIEPAYGRALAEIIADDTADVQSAVGLTETQVAALAAAAGFTVERFVNEIEIWHRRRFATTFTPVGVNLGTLLTRGDVSQTLDAIIRENVSLIRSLSDQMRNGVSGAVFRGLQNRTPARDVAREIRRIAGVGQRRAELIASDQLAKLTSRLDEQRQRQAGIRKFKWQHSGKTNYRPEHLARDGDIFTWGEGIAESDPPGRAIRCGCRAQAVLEIDENADDAPAPPEPTPEPTPAPTPSVQRPRRVLTPPPEPTRVAGPAPTAAGRGFRSPVNRAVNDDTVQVEKRLALQKRLSAELAEAARDPRYADVGRWRGRSARDEGRATFSTEWSDEAASVVAAVKPELDDLADQLGIPRVRGYKTTTGSQNADMGGGIMALSPGEFNARAARVGGGSAEDIAEAARLRSQALLEQQRELAPRIERLRNEQFAAYEAGDTVVYAQVRAQRDALVKEYEKLYRQRKKLSTAAGRASRQAARPQSTWRPGDNVADRPYSAAYYYPEGMDRARSTLFHEFAHHVHQQLNRVGTYTRPLETRLGELWREARANVANHRNRQASTYATTNQYEWFAENFSLFVMGKTDLVDPILRDLIEGIFRGEF